MALFHAGVILKRCREQKNLSQQRVCDGICDVSTLARIENGKSVPNNYTFQCLMERLGNEAHVFCVIKALRQFYQGQLGILQNDVLT